MRSVANYLRSGFDGLCIAWAAWAVQTGFASGDRLRLGAAVRRLPLAAETPIRALVMTAAIVVVSGVLEIALYAHSFFPARLITNWIPEEAPASDCRDWARPFRAPGNGDRDRTTDRRPASDQCCSRDLSSSGSPAVDRDVPRHRRLQTRLAEALGELRVHDLITRFFFDIDEPIRAFGGAVRTPMSATR